MKITTKSRSVFLSANRFLLVRNVYHFRSAKAYNSYFQREKEERSLTLFHPRGLVKSDFSRYITYVHSLRQSADHGALIVCFGAKVNY